MEGTVPANHGFAAPAKSEPGENVGVEYLAEGAIWKGRQLQKAW